MSIQEEKTELQKAQEALEKLQDFINNPNSTMREFDSLACCLKDFNLSCPIEDTTTQNET